MRSFVALALAAALAGRALLCGCAAECAPNSAPSNVAHAAETGARQTRTSQEPATQARVALDEARGACHEEAQPSAPGAPAAPSSSQPAHGAPSCPQPAKQGSCCERAILSAPASVIAKLQAVERVSSVFQAPAVLAARDFFPANAQAASPPGNRAADFSDLAPPVFSALRL